MISDQIAGFAMGNSAEKDTSQFEGDLARFSGTCKGRGRRRDMSITVTDNDTTLLAKNEYGEPRKLRFVRENEWSDDGASYIFDGPADGTIRLSVDETYGYLRLSGSEIEVLVRSARNRYIEGQSVTKCCLSPIAQ